MTYRNELDVAIKAAALAGERILKVYDEAFEVAYKKDSSPVTEADVSAGLAIEQFIKAHFPEDGFLSEEMEDDGSRYQRARFWVVDPLDGTKEFVKKNDEFAVNIGLVDRGKVVLGVVYVPVTETVYYAVSGQGAYRKNDSKLERLSVSNRYNPVRLLISRSHPSPRTSELIDLLKSRIECIKEMGSSIKGCLIAAGEFDIYYNFGTSMKWDTCALDCIVKEAGGIMKRLDGEPINYTENSPYNKGFYIVNDAANEVKL
ncbi:MAG: 3(2), 5-bisphosphate nucleotidase [Clostridiales bacterium]|jgi:3'(2'), 5'-bisphosphate nucleotidase|nr:3(2), 5-bisphosphate nucleotidase [Clostridiales bacterium]MDN5297547.1 3(2), 5-bisphosphate nucleotidase [Clostridiales bacterium]